MIFFFFVFKTDTQIETSKTFKEYLFLRKKDISKSKLYNLDKWCAFFQNTTAYKSVESVKKRPCYDQSIAKLCKNIYKFMATFGTS